MAKATADRESRSSRSDRSTNDTNHKVNGQDATSIARDPARDSALSRAVQQIEKQFGKGAVMKLDDQPKVLEGIATGSLSLDIALGGTGIPKGRVVEIF